MGVSATVRGDGVPVGVIGLGAMGRGMAASLLRAGYLVHACDVRREAADAFADGLAAACAAWRPWSDDAAGVDAVREAPCLVHGDPTPGNVIIRPDGTLLLLDWEYAQAGGPWDDLAALVAGEPDAPPGWSAEVPSDARPRFDAALRLRRLLDALWHALRAGIPVDA